jgi:hypothetical protein
MFEALGKPAAVILLLLSGLGLVACGESSSEKATKKVCSATSEISKQLKKLETLPINSTFPTEAKTSVEAIDKSVKEIKEAESSLPSARQEELNAADKAFETEIAAITKSVTTASKSSSPQAALKSAEPEIKAALTKVSDDYKKAFEALKCS